MTFYVEMTRTVYFPFPYISPINSSFDQDISCHIESLGLVAWWFYMARYIWMEFDSDNGLLPEGVEPLPEPMLTCHWNFSATLTWEQFHSWTHFVTCFQILELWNKYHISSDDLGYQIYTKQAYDIMYYDFWSTIPNPDYSKLGTYMMPVNA